MTFNNQCKTCNLTGTESNYVDDAILKGEGNKTISRNLFEKFNVKISRESIRNHRANHLGRDEFTKTPSTTVTNPKTDITPGFEIDSDGNGFAQTPPMEDHLISSVEDILKNMGIDTDVFEVVGTARISKWQQNDEGPLLTSYRVNIRKKPSNQKDVEELIPYIKDYSPTVSTSVGDHAFVFVAGDLQLGKSDGDGTEGIIRRYRESLQKAVDKLNTLDEMVSEILISWVGDCIEGMVSQGGRNSRRTELTTTQQVRLLRLLMTETIRAFAPLSNKVTVVSVPGNHDEAQREPVSTDPSDSWAVDALVAVSEALKFNPEAFGHVDCKMVPYDEMTTTVEVAGTKITHAHGHQWSRGKHYEWWSGQHWGGHDVGEADILLAGHYHTGLYEQENKKHFIRVPSMEKESTYFRHRTGKIGNPSAVTFLTKNGKIKYLDFE